MSVARPAHASIARAPFNCDPWTGRPSEYQMEARAVLQERFHDPLPWIYAVTSCETKHCLTTLHLNYHRARKINYPAGVCTYCGLPGFTKDHLLPVTSTGLAVRRYVAVVPACGECNSGIGDRVGHRVGERRDQAHEYIRIKHRRTLNAPKWTPQLLAELGPNLRAFMQHSEDLREVVNTRLAWPLDPDYDLRAFQKSGIDDPYGLDLI